MEAKDDDGHGPVTLAVEDKPTELPCSGGDPKMAHSLEQAQSLLFKLPVEIRTMIYEHVFTGDMFHVHSAKIPFETVPHRVPAHLMTKKTEKNHSETKLVANPYQRTRRGLILETQQPDFLRIKGTGFHTVDLNGLLKVGPREQMPSLFLTCHKIYNETIELYYSRNSFEFFCYRAFHNFYYMTPKPLFQLIKTMTLSRELLNLICGSGQSPSPRLPPLDLALKDSMIHVQTLRISGSPSPCTEYTATGTVKCEMRTSEGYPNLWCMTDGSIQILSSEWFLGLKFVEEGKLKVCGERPLGWDIANGKKLPGYGHFDERKKTLWQGELWKKFLVKRGKTAAVELVDVTEG